MPASGSLQSPTVPKYHDASGSSPGWLTASRGPGGRCSFGPCQAPAAAGTAQVRAGGRMKVLTDLCGLWGSIRALVALGLWVPAGVLEWSVRSLCWREGSADSALQAPTGQDGWGQAAVWLLKGSFPALQYAPQGARIVRPCGTLLGVCAIQLQGRPHSPACTHSMTSKAAKDKHGIRTVSLSFQGPSAMCLGYQHQPPLGTPLALSPRKGTLPLHGPCLWLPFFVAFFRE